MRANLKKKYFLILILLFSYSIENIYAQCPTIDSLKLNNKVSTSIFCSSDSMRFNIDVRNTLLIDSVALYWDTIANFNPYNSQGNLFASAPVNVKLASNPCEVCPIVQAIFINACNGSGNESDNEFMIFNSGSGFFANHLQIKYNQNNSGQDAHINFGFNACGLQNPTNDLLTRIKSNLFCDSSNVIPIGPSDTIPANVSVFLFHSNNITQTYDFSNFCATGSTLYVMQSNCKRTIGAYGNAESGNTDSVVLSLSNCICRDAFKWNRTNMAIQDGVFATRHASGIASVANGGVQRNTSNPCEGPLTSFSPLDIVVPPIDFLIKEKSQNDARFNICGYDTIYIKAIFKNHPNSFSCPNSSIEATRNTIKVLIHCPDVKIIGDTPLCGNSINRFEAKPLYNLPLGSKSYQWQNGSNDTFLNVSQPTILKLVYQKENCKDSALLNVRNNNKISKEIDINLDSCKSIVYNGVIFDKDTQWIDTFKFSNSTCDSIFEKVFIKINKNPIIENTKCIVSGDTVLFYGQKIHQPGTYQHIVNIGKKCDSIYRINVDTVIPMERLLPQVISCQSYTYKGIEYKESTTIIDTLRSIFNCDSLYQKIPLKLYKTSNLKPIEVNACDSFQIGNQVFYKDTSYIFRIPYRQIANCDSQVITYQIKINETLSNQIIISSKPPYYIGDKITLSAALSAKSYLWNYKNDTNKSIAIIAEIPMWYKLTTLNLDLCSFADSIFINPQERDPYFSLPTAFSPNGDFRNDVFRPQRQKDISWISMTIFNRLGEMVYKHLGDYPSWDGNYKDEPQPEGVYLVIFEYFQNGQLKTYRSNLNLFR